MRAIVINSTICLALLISGALLGTSHLHAQDDASVTCTVSQNPVPSGSRVNLTISLINCQPKGGKIDRPSIPGLRYLGGPSVSQQHSTINFQSTSTYSYTYTYQVNSKENVKIPPIKLATNNGVKNSEAFILQVAQRGSGTQKQGLGNVASVIEINKKRVHLGEPILIQYKIYSRFNNIQYREEIPELEGFWKEELPVRQSNRSLRQINGVEYLEIIVKEVIAFPQQTGEFTINGFDVYGVVSLSFFNQKEVQTQSTPVTVTVVPLPEGQLYNFMGTFGKLRVDAVVDVDSVNVNEAFNYELTYSGKGNLKLIREPELDWPSEFEVFDPEIIDRINVTTAGESGKRTYKYTVIPRAPGTYKLPELRIGYYEHIKDKYMKETADAGNIVVKRDPNAVGGSTVYSPKSQVQVLNHDIRHISTDHGHWVAYNESTGWRALIWLMYAIGPLFAVWALWSRRLRDAESDDVIGTRHKRALKIFKRSLAKCQDYQQLGEAIEVYLSSKFGWGRSSFSRDLAAKTLVEQLSEEEAKAWDGLLKKCEMARFAPGTLPHVEDAILETIELVKMSDSKIGFSAKAMLVLALLFATFFTETHAQESTSKEDVKAQYEFANNAYLAADYELSAATYEEISKEYRCFELEYNLGNCYYKLERVGPTILHYERAKLIDPLDDDLRANILLADLRVIDKIEPLPGVGLEKMLDVLFAGKMYGIWLILSLICWTLGFALLGIRFKWKTSIIYPFANAGTIILISTSIIFSTLLYNTHERISTSACAIVMEDKVDVMSIPGTTGLKLFHLHEGAKGCILSEEGNWTEIRLENGNVGWLVTEAIERI